MHRIRRSCAVLVLLTALLPAASAAAAGTSAVARRSTAPQRWSDPRTWAGDPPQAGDRVTIRAGTRVVLDTSPPPLAGLQVDGTLTFARKDLELTSDWIVVHGELRVGKPDQPFRQRAVITLTGDDPGADVMGMGTKVLGVMGGTLDLHGRKRRTWTHLDATVQRGGDRITLESDVPWGPGDRIVIASSDYWRQHDEVRTIVAVSGRTLALDAPLEYRHWGELQSFGGHVVDERAEVGLLSHNVVVRGDEGADGFGGHLMVMEGSTARIEGVELSAMGQRKTLKRYPVHFHMHGDAAGSYLERSTIHDSSNRCVVVHGTSGLVVRDNVCYDHAGHGFFLEDGIETGNVLVGNLGLGTRKVEDGLLPSDAEPATFWITNPDNVVKDNVAAGSDGTGFWYALPKHAMGLSADDGVWPRRTPLGEFSGNVSHSNAVDGLNVEGSLAADGSTEFGRYAPVEDPRDARSAPVPARFEDLTSYMNRNRGAWFGGHELVLTGATLADNRVGATFASTETFLEDSVVVGETANPGTTEPWEDPSPSGRALPAFWDRDRPITGFEFYDGRVGVRRTTFASFVPSSLRPSAGLAYLAPDAFSIDPANFAEDVRFVDANRVWLASPEEGMDGDASKVFYDHDGSVTGTPGAAVVVDNPFLLDEGCVFEADWNAHVCDSDYVSLLAGSPGDEDAVKPLTIRRADGVEQRLMGCCHAATEAFTTLLPERSYEVTFNGGLPGDVKLVLVDGRSRWLQVSLTVPGPVAVTRWEHPLRELSGLAALRDRADSGYYFDPVTSTVHVKLFGNGEWEEVHVRPRA